MPALPYLLASVGRDGAFAHSTVTHTSQSHTRVAVPLSFLFGLDTDIALQFCALTSRQKQLRNYDARLSKDYLPQLWALRAKFGVWPYERAADWKECEAGSKDKRYSIFTAIIEEEAASLDARIRELNDENYSDQQLVLDLTQATQTEASPGLPDLERLYKEANVVLPGVSLNRYEEVRAFHDQVVANRRNHLFRRDGSG